MVPVADPARFLRARRDEIVGAFDRIMASGRLLLGPELLAFEEEFAAFTGHLYAVGLASGTDAIRLTLASLGIGHGHEVIVPAFTAMPTLAAVCAVGAVPVPVDVDPETAAMDLTAAAAAVTGRTRAVMPVHLYGRPADLPDLGLPVIEDAAQAHGALGNAGSTAVAYSFYPTKNVGGIGDGGAVVTDDEALADRLRLLRHHGMDAAYVHTSIATNSRMSEIEAAVLRLGLAALSQGNARRRAIATRYRAAAPQLHWQADHPDHVFHLCVARVPERDAFRAAMPFATGIHYPLAVTQQPAYRHLARRECPEAEGWAAECVSLPCFPELTDHEVAVVCSALSHWDSR